MGGDFGPEKLDQLQKSSAEDVERDMDALQAWLEDQPDYSKHPHVGVLFRMMKGAVDVVLKEIAGTEAAKTGPEYYQAQVAIKLFKKQAGVFFGNPVEDTFSPLLGSSGHFVDRVSQKILAIGGTSQLKEGLNSLIKEQHKLSAIIKNLQESAEVLGSFSKTQMIEGLHSQYTRDANSAKCGAYIWLFISILTAVVLLRYAYLAITIVPLFLKSLTLPNNGVNLFMLLSMSPRVLIVGGLVTIGIACWKNYHTYMHLSVSARRKEISSKLLPILTQNMSASDQSKLKHEFLMRMVADEETGFIIQTKQQPGIQFPKISEN